MTAHRGHGVTPSRLRSRPSKRWIHQGPAGHRAKYAATSASGVSFVGMPCLQSTFGSFIGAGIGLAIGVGERGLRTRAHLVVADLRDIRYDGIVLDLRDAHILRHREQAKRPTTAAQ